MREAATNGVEERLKLLRAFDIERDDLLRNVWGPPHSYIEEAHEVGQALATAELVAAVDLETVSVATLEALAARVEQVRQAAEAIKKMGAEQFFKGSNHQQQRGALLADLLNAGSSLSTFVAPLLSLQHHRGRAVFEAEAKAMLRDIEAVKADAEAAKVAATEIVEVMRNASADVGVSKHSENFTTLAEAHGSSAFWWLVTSVGLLLLWFGAAWLLYKDVSGLEYQKLVMRVAVLFAGLGAITWAARNYKASRHNQVVNEHRATALDTFQTFVHAAGDPETKQAVLLQATHTIFVAQPSGFSAQGEPPGSPATTVVEILRSAHKSPPSG